MRWSLLFAVLVLACKPAVREEKSDLHAIADDSLTLGVTAVEKDDVQAYRLLVCKKAMSYPKWMLEDSSRCLPGLLTAEGEEVIILPDHLRRDFATKYKGYAKEATQVVGVTLAAVGAVLGGKALLKGTDVATKVGDVAAGAATKVGDVAAGAAAKVGNVAAGAATKVGDATKGLTNRQPVKFFAGVGVKTKDFTTKRVDFVTDQWGRFTGWFGKTVEGVKRKIPDRFKGKSKAYSSTPKVDGEDYIKKYKDTGETKYLDGAREKAHIFDAEERLLALNRTKKFLQNKEGIDGKNINDLIGKDADIDSFIGSLPRDSNFMEEYGRLAPIENSPVNHLSKRFRIGRAHYQMDSNREIVEVLEASSNDAKAINSKIKELNTEITGVERALQDNASSVGPLGLKWSQIRRSLRRGAIGTAGAAGAAAVAYPVLVSLDKSLWGYSDRQVSKHWSQIFHDQGDFGADSTSVRDLPGILKSLADAYGFVVNSEAIALGN